MADLSLEQQADLASLAYELGHNPQTRGGLAQLVNKINPQRARASFPDVVQEERFKQLERKVADQLDLTGAKAAKAKIDEQRHRLKDRYTEDEIAKIEAVADRIGTHDYDAAAVIYAHENPAPDPMNQAPDQMPSSTWEFPTVAGRDGKPVGFKDFVADPRKHSMNAAYNVISEFKNAKLSPPFRR